MMPTAHELYATKSNSREYLATVRKRWHPDCLPHRAWHLCSMHKLPRADGAPMSRAPMRNGVPDAHIYAPESSSHEQRPCVAPARSAYARVTHERPCAKMGSAYSVTELYSGCKAMQASMEAMNDYTIYGNKR